MGKPTVDSGDSGASPDPKKPDVRFEDAQSNIKLIHANLTDINGYAQYMNMTSVNLLTASASATGPLTAGLLKAFKGSASGTVPEAVDISNELSQNTEDFKNFFTDLCNGMQNIGNAAQVISDSYGGTDGLSKASLDGVAFAFADPTGKRPPGLSNSIGDLQSEVDEAAQEKAGTTAGSAQANPEDYGATAVDVTGNPMGTTYTYADGSSIYVASAAGGSITTIYGVPGSDGGMGKVLGSTKKQLTYGDGQASTSTETLLDADGKPVRTTTTKTDEQGNVDLTIETPGSKPGDDPTIVTQHVAVGDTPTGNSDPSELEKETKDYGGIGDPGYGMLPG